MSYDPASISNRMDFAETGCPRCRGRGYTLYEKDNPATAEPCGCDEPDEAAFEGWFGNVETAFAAARRAGDPAFDETDSETWRSHFAKGLSAEAAVAEVLGLASA